MIEKIKEYYKRRKLLNRYNKKKINPQFYGVVDVSRLATTQPMTAPVSGTFHVNFGDKKMNINNDIHENIDKLIKIIEE